MKHILLLASAFSLVSSSVYAAQGTQCDNQTQCSSSEACIESNCVPDGNVNVTVSWTSNTDLDLHLRTPDASEISPDLPDKITAQGGRIVFDQCFSETCKDDTRTSSHPHVEHITWARGTPVVKGKYFVWVENFDGAEAADFRIVVEKPNGEREIFEGSVSATALEASAEFEFDIEFEASCVGDTDTDGDGLCDDWEINGLDVNGDGVVDLDLPALGADPKQKDLFVEFDWMKDQEPFPLGAVNTAFSNANVLNPNGGTGIRLHLQRGEEITNISGTAVGGTDALPISDLQRIKFGADGIACSANEWFGSQANRDDANCEHISKAREMVYRYAVFGYTRPGTSSSGRGDLPGNDFIVTIGSWGTSNNQHRQVGTFMHELGHTLGIRHGGIDNTNCKPNHLSVMNYNYQFDSMYAGRPLDYSRKKLPTLNEALLIEADGVSGLASWAHVYFGDAGSNVDGGPAHTSKDWDNDGTITDVALRADITQSSNCGAAGIDVLHGHSGWSDIVYNFRNSASYEGSGIGEDEDEEEPEEELTKEQDDETAQQNDTDQDGFSNAVDVCPAVSDPEQLDADSDGVGDECDDCPNDPAPGFMTGCPVDPTIDPDNPDEPAKTDSTDPTDSNDDSDNDSSDDSDDSDADDEERERAPQHQVPDSCSTTPASSASLWLLVVAFFGTRRRRRTKTTEV